MATTWRMRARCATEARSGSAWATSPAGTRSWTRTATWFRSGTSSSPPEPQSSDRRAVLWPTRRRDPAPTPVMKSISPRLAPYLQVAPLTLVLLVFFGVPLVFVIVVSFFGFDDVGIIPRFYLGNYVDVSSSAHTLRLYAKTIEFAAIVWAITLVVGFTVAYFLVFHVRSVLWQMALFLLCTVPFWTSNIIRMISWIPFLGINGIFNQSLIALGVTDHPLEFLLFSNFSVVI